MVTHSTLHYTIMRHIIDKSYAPDVTVLSDLLHCDEEEVTKGLYALQDYHGVVLHPNEPRIWVMHPFSLAPDKLCCKIVKRGMVG